MAREACNSISDLSPCRDVTWPRAEENLKCLPQSASAKRRVFAAVNPQQIIQNRNSQAMERIEKSIEVNVPLSHRLQPMDAV